MVAKNIIQYSIQPLKLAMSVQFALDCMAEYRLRQLPVVEAGKVLGFVKDDVLVDALLSNTSLENCVEAIPAALVSQDLHVYELLRLYKEAKLPLFAVLNHEQEYLGMVDAEALLNALTTLFALGEKGSIVVLEIAEKEYSLAHLAQLVEEQQAAILSTNVQSFAHASRLEVTLLINRRAVDAIVASFERHNYTVLTVFNQLEGVVTDDMHRYDHLMNYLNQ